MLRMRVVWIAAVALIALGAAACAGGGGAASSSAPSMTPSMGSMSPSMGSMSPSMTGSMAPQMDTSAFGKPGTGSQVDRTVKVTQLDTFRFQPASLSVKKGDTVRFDLTNGGQIPHEFVIGDAAYQQAEEAMMKQSGGQMGNRPNAVLVQPGQTTSVIWTFTVPGRVIYGCHVPGHYAAGMRGTVRVSAA